MAVGTLGLGLVALLSLGLALRAPLATTAIALMLFGVLHNVLELRYVGGRFAGLLSGTFATLMGALITGIVIARLVGAVFGGGWTVRAEIVISYGLVAVAAWLGLRRRRGWLLATLAVLVLATLTSLAWPAYHVVLITHLHNLLPLAFLWEFSHRWPAFGRRLFRATQLGWVVIVPTLILAGGVDSWIDSAAADIRMFSADPAVLAAGVAPPGEWGTTIGLRLLVVFAFLQLMHFVVWICYLPRYAPAASKAFDARVPWLRGWRTWALGLGVGALLFVLFAVDYGQGRTVYSALASYHAYLELPLLIALFLGLGRSQVSTGRTARVD